MRIVVSSIVWVSMKKIALWIRVHVDDLTAGRAIIAGNAEKVFAKNYMKMKEIIPGEGAHVPNRYANGE